VAVGFQAFFYTWILPLPDIYIFIANLIGSDGWGYHVPQDRIPDAPRHRRHYPNTTERVVEVLSQVQDRSVPW
jgi:hypothetical protein